MAEATRGGGLVEPAAAAELTDRRFLLRCYGMPYRKYKATFHASAPHRRRPSSPRRPRRTPGAGVPPRPPARGGARSGQAPLQGGTDCKGDSIRISNSVTEPDVAERIHKFYEEAAIPAESFARAVAFAMSQPEDVDVNEILFRPTRQEL
jgi:hypothetical protein